MSGRQAHGKKFQSIVIGDGNSRMPPTPKGKFPYRAALWNHSEGVGYVVVSLLLCTKEDKFTLDNRFLKLEKINKT